MRNWWEIYIDTYIHKLLIIFEYSKKINFIKEKDIMFHTALTVSNFANLIFLTTMFFGVYAELELKAGSASLS